MNRAIILLLGITLFSCGQKHTRTEKPLTEKPLKEKIMGSWKTTALKGDLKGRTLVFTFQDSTCTHPYPHPWGGSVKILDRWRHIGHH